MLSTTGGNRHPPAKSPLAVASRSTRAVASSESSGVTSHTDDSLGLFFPQLAAAASPHPFADLACGADGGSGYSTEAFAAPLGGGDNAGSV
eukprot:CAMPEP_0115178396 /NCGR_PEP_ID=MMETSP0270-20121206/5879_1 /TAXON_ID=71861 /ORGANISM="Scrippsiella trochoidea, Strain CCMP3099" /LENGTH=90 /DNA_ID=CAMNT_0002591357 /DNA_START=528 /DNA_END=800 /DNA_ORIENTATION=-